MEAGVGSLRVISPEMDKVIDSILSSSGQADNISKNSLTKADFNYLKSGTCLNGEVISAYLKMIMNQIKDDYNWQKVYYAFDTYLYPQLLNGFINFNQAASKTPDFFNYDLLLIPIHLGCHWCLAVVNFRTKKICYFESMMSDNDKCLELIEKYLQVNKWSLKIYIDYLIHSI